MTRLSVELRPGESASAHETFTASTCSAAQPRHCPPASASPAWCPCPLHLPLPRKCPQKVDHPLLPRVLSHPCSDLMVNKRNNVPPGEETQRGLLITCNAESMSFLSCCLLQMFFSGGLFQTVVWCVISLFQTSRTRDRAGLEHDIGIFVIHPGFGIQVRACWGSTGGCQEAAAQSGPVLFIPKGT